MSLLIRLSNAMSFCRMSLTELIYNLKGKNENKRQNDNPTNKESN